MTRTVVLWALAAFFVVAGTNHLLNPGSYLAMMPPHLPWHAALVIISGVAEIAGGLGSSFPEYEGLRVGADCPAGGGLPGAMCRWRCMAAWRTDTAVDFMGAPSPSRCVDRLGLFGL